MATHKKECEGRMMLETNESEAEDVLRLPQFVGERSERFPTNIVPTNRSRGLLDFQGGSRPCTKHRCFANRGDSV